MISDKEYVRLSLEMNLFFLRIIREHNYFAAVSLPPKGQPISMQFIAMNRNINRLLSATVSLSHGNISKQIMNSGELITEFTLPAEKAAQFLTGVPIDTSITTREADLGYREHSEEREDLTGRISQLNKEIIATVTHDISFFNQVLNQVLSCKAFGYTYPLNVDHIIREEKLYLAMLNKLQNKQEEETTVESLIHQEIFWNDIMHEHSEFIRGYLDPSERELFKTANRFAEEFETLEGASKKLISNKNNFKKVTDESYRLTKDLRNFKRKGTEGLLLCKIKAIMPALLADHVTREANHYLRILSSK